PAVTSWNESSGGSQDCDVTGGSSPVPASVNSVLPAGAGVQSVVADVLAAALGAGPVAAARNSTSQACSSSAQRKRITLTSPTPSPGSTGSLSATKYTIWRISGYSGSTVSSALVLESAPIVTVAV